MSTTYAQVNLASLGHNLEEIRRRLAPSCDIVAIVKANAYGHGAAETARELIRLGITRLAVVSVPEGMVLREAGITRDLLVLGMIGDEQLADMVAFRLTPVVSDSRRLPALAHAAASKNVALPIHIKLDTGMGRLGLSPEEILPAFEQLEAFKSLRVEGLMTHLADADGKTAEQTERQLARFRETVETLRRRGIDVPLVHAANSAAIVRFAEAHFSLVRPGIMLYGYHTLPTSVPAPNLKPVLSLKTAVGQVRTLRSGTTVSYNGTFTAGRTSRIAVLPIGYADGYSRRLSNRGAVLIHGRRAPIVGLVCMDMTMVDVTDIPETQVGDEVVVIGRQGEDAIWADDIAEWTGTIPYEVLCSIGPRVPRVYTRLD
ncbi:MAG TPA: alanine racemase [Nitrospira sp.]|nr:alanine racemase [Nitrospira sp.]